MQMLVRWSRQPAEVRRVTRTGARGPEDLSRGELARLGREFMLYGHLYDRALMPQVAMRLGGGSEIEPLSIWEWKGASPNYTRRMKRLMRIEGDDVVAIVKALQL